MIHAPAPEPVLEEPALVDACFCDVCREPNGNELVKAAHHLNHMAFREYWRLREQRRQVPAPTPEIRRRVLIPLLRRLA